MARHYALRASNSDRVTMCVLVRDIRKDLRDSNRPPRKHFPIVAIGAGDEGESRHHHHVRRGRLSAFFPPRSLRRRQEQGAAFIGRAARNLEDSGAASRSLRCEYRRPARRGAVPRAPHAAPRRHRSRRPASAPSSRRPRGRRRSRASPAPPDGLAPRRRGIAARNGPARHLRLRIPATTPRRRGPTSR